MKARMFIGMLLAVTYGQLANSAEIVLDPNEISTEITQEAPLPITTISKGVRVAISIPNFDAKTKVSAMGQSFSSKDDADAKMGLSVGYANIATNKAGFLGLLNYTTFDGGDDGDMAGMRLEGSANYGINQNLYLFGGLNMHKFVKGDYIKDLDIDLGLQVGIGFQMTPNIGMDFKYLTTNNGGNVNVSGIGLNADVELRGIEIGLHSTF